MNAKNSTKDRAKSFEERLTKLLEDNIGTLEEKGIAARDFSNIPSALEKLSKQRGDSYEEKWRKKLQEVLGASDAIERLALTGEATDFEKKFGCKLIFDKKSKKKQAS